MNPVVANLHLWIMISFLLALVIRLYRRLDELAQLIKELNKVINQHSLILHDACLENSLNKQQEKYGH